MIAERRLRTIYEATELGAGFGIAMKDLEIRGAGTLLGMRQSGHITAVGFNLYTELLSQAVEQEKARRAGLPPPDLRPANLPSPGVDLPIPAFIPDEYVADLNTRLGLYQKLMKVSRPEHLEEMSQEFTDRFGPLPTEVRNLLFTVKIKSQATLAGIQSVSTSHGEIVITLFDGLNFEAPRVGRMMRELMVPDNAFGFDNLNLRLNYRRLGPRWREVLDGVVRRLA
jgi:transcription-repair coupling factor (superfamily II helicase)